MALNIFQMSAAAMTGRKPVRRVPFLASQSLTPSGTSAQSSAFTGEFVTLQNTGTGNVYVVFGVNPTAITGTSFAIGEGMSEDFEVNRGDKVAVIT